MPSPDTVFGCAVKRLGLEQIEYGGALPADTFRECEAADCGLAAVLIESCHETDPFAVLATRAGEPLNKHCIEVGARIAADEIALTIEFLADEGGQ